MVVGNEHPLARQSRVAFADLPEYTWILQPAHSPMRDVMEREFQVHQAAMPPGLDRNRLDTHDHQPVRKSRMVRVIRQRSRSGTPTMAY